MNKLLIFLAVAIIPGAWCALAIWYAFFRHQKKRDLAEALAIASLKKRLPR